MGRTQELLNRKRSGTAQLLSGGTAGLAGGSRTRKLLERKRDGAAPSAQPGGAQIDRGAPEGATPSHASTPSGGSRTRRLLARRGITEARDPSAPANAESKAALQTLRDTGEATYGGKTYSLPEGQEVDWANPDTAGKALSHWGKRLEQIRAEAQGSSAEMSRYGRELETLGKRITEMEADPRLGKDPIITRAYENSIEKYNRQLLPAVQEASGRYEQGRQAYNSLLEEYQKGWAAYREAMPEEQRAALEKAEGYKALAGAADFEEKSRYRSTANGKEKFSSISGIYTDTGFDDTLYDFINGNETAQGHQMVNDTRSNTTHEHLKGLPEEAVKTFNYIYATEGPEAAYAYIDFVTDRAYTGIEAMALGVLEGTGMPSVSAAAGAALGTGESKARNQAWYSRLKQDAAAARGQHPAMYGAGSVGGTLALMAGAGRGLSAAEGILASGIRIGGKTVALQMTPLAQGVVNSGLTFLAKDAVQNAGSAATGLVSSGDYVKSVGISGVQGMAGGLAGGLAGSGMAGILRETGMMTPFMEFVRQSASGFASASANIGAGYVLREEKPSKEQVAEDLTAAFLFSVLQSGISAYSTTRAEKAAMEAALDRVQSEYSAMSRGMGDMGVEARAAQAEKVIAQTRSLRASLNSRYMAGQQAAVDDMNRALDAIEAAMQGYVDGVASSSAAAAPGGLPGGAAVAGGTASREAGQLRRQIQEAMEQGLAQYLGGQAAQWKGPPAQPQAGLLPVPGAEAARGVGTAAPEERLQPLKGPGKTAEAPQAAPQGAKEAAPGTGTAREYHGQILDTVRKNLDKVRGMESVAQLTGSEFQKTEGDNRNLRQKVIEFFNGLGNRVNRPGMGEIELNAAGARDSTAHGYGKLRAATFAALPSVLEHGILVDVRGPYEGHNYDSYIISAPVEVDGTTCYVGALVIKSTNMQRYKLHEVLTTDENGVPLFKSESAGKTDGPLRSDTPFEEPGGSPTVSVENALLDGERRGQKVASPGVSSSALSDTTIAQPAGDVNGETGGKTWNGGLNDGEGAGGPVPAQAGGEAGGAGEGAGVYGGGQGRVFDPRTGGEAGRLGTRPGTAGSAFEQSRAAAARQDRAKDFRRERISSQELGLEAGTDTRSIISVPMDDWDDDMFSTAERVWDETGVETAYVLGGIEVMDRDGQSRRVRGVYERGKRIIIQADNMRCTIDQIADHEVFHDKAFQTPGLIREIEDKITRMYGREAFNRVVDIYIQRLRGIVDVPEDASGEEIEAAFEAVLEEIYADAYAGINAFGANAGQFRGAVEQALEDRWMGRRGQETARATDRTTGPPQYSFAGKHVPTYEELIKKPDVQIVDIRGERTGRIADLRKDFLNSAQAKRLYAAPVVNRDTGEALFITPRTITHTFSNKGTDQIALAEHLPEVIREAVLTHGEQSRKAPGDQSTGVFTLLGAVQTKVGVQPVKLKVKEYYIAGQDIPQTIREYLGTGIQPQTYAHVYDGKVLVLESIEKEEASSSALSATSQRDKAGKYPSTSSLEEASGSAITGAVQSTAVNYPSTSSTISVKDLLGLVKGDAERYVPKGGKPGSPERGIRYSYGGKNARHADSGSLETAERLEMQGLTAEEIRQETGWFRGMDGQWRFEIDDSGMEYSRWGDMNRSDRAEYARFRELEQRFIDGSLTAEGRTELRDLIDRGHGPGRAEERGTLKLSDFIRHDKLFENYPQLRKAGLRFEKLPEGVRGSFDGRDIVLSESLRDAPEDTLLHEIQHAIQRAEGFARGATWEYWNRRLEEGYVPPQEEAETKRIEAAMRTIREIEGAAPEGFLSKLREYQYLENYIASEEGAADLDAWERAEAVRTELEERYGGLFQKWFDADWERQMAEGSRSKVLPSDLYQNTAGEIEARDVASRRQLTTAERRLALPDLGDGNTVFAEGGNYGYAMSTDEQAGVKKQLREHREELDSMVPAAVLNRSDLAGMTTNQARVKLAAELKKTGYKVERPDFGIIQFTEKEINSSLNYKEQSQAAEDARRTAMLALPQVLKRGKEISRHRDHKGRGYGTITIAAPVVINGKRGNMAVIIRETKGSRYKVHRILTPDGGAFRLEKMDSAEGYTVGGITDAVQTSGEVAPANSFRTGVSIPQASGKSKGENQELQWVSLPAPDVGKPGPRYSVDEGETDWENRPKTELEAVEQELERLRDLDYQTEPLRRGGAAAIAENEAAARRLQKRADRLRGEAGRDKQPRPAKKEIPQKERRPAPKPVAESKPIIAKRDFRENILGAFSIPEGSRAELGKVADSFAERLLREGKLTEQDRRDFFNRMYSSGVMTIAADEYFQEGRKAVSGGRIYVNESVRGDFGEDWNGFRRRAMAAGVYLTNDRSDAGVDVWNHELGESLPGLFNMDELDGRTALERIVQVAEEGRDEKMSLAEYTARLAGEEYVSEQEILDNLERQMDWALRTFAEKAELEIRLRNRTGVKIAQERERFAESSRRQREREALRRGKEREQRREMMERQRENRELRELQKKTLKQLQWLNKNRYRAPEELRSAWDEVLGDIDLYAVGAANEMNWSKKYGATWRDLAQMYQAAKESDPNFLPSKDLDGIVERLDGEKIADMDIGALQDLYKAAVGLRTEFYNRNNVINDEQGRIFAEVYADSKREIGEATGGYTGKGLDMYLNLEQLTPMNVLERMGGWNPDGAFYSMAKQLEQGERDARAYTVQAKRQIEDFLTENEDWVKRADGQGEDAIWYELEVPELLKLGMGDKPVFGPAVKVYMTPAQKVQLYLESKNYDNLRHMTGGRTFVNRELYSQGKRAEALAQGVTVKLAPETVKKIGADLTEEEMELAKMLEHYYNGFAAGEINRVSNPLLGYDKAISRNYAPIFTNRNFNRSEPGVFNVTAEGVPHMKGRIPYSKNPSYNLSAFDAFERHVDQTARFVGYAIPVQNMNRLLNWQDTKTSTRDVIAHKWGDQSVKYIDDLLTELQGPKIEEKSGAEKLADTVLSNYISSVFGANPSIVFKQAMSFPLAGTYLGWENLPNIAAALRTDDKLINTYTSELAYRLMGYATPETAQLKNNPSKLSQNKVLRFTFGGGAITAMDGWTVKSMWRWAENAARRENPELETGTQEQVYAGQSPFYQEVARRFEEAVSRSQPMYDVMHRPDIMRNGNGFTRALTLFKTVPLQQYNMLRQTIEEAKRAKRIYGADSQASKEARKRAGRAVLGVILATLGIEAINFLNAMLKNGAKRYKDEDEDEMTWASVGKEFLSGFLKDSAGMIAGGDAAAEYLEKKITGERWYGIETPGITQIQEVLEELRSAGDTIGELIRDGIVLHENGGDLKEYFRRHGADYLGALEKGLSTVATYFGGVAYNNVKGYALSALRWMSPETETAFQDWLKTADKSGLKGLKGKALETRIYDILKNRTGKAEETTAVELAALYAAGYKAAVPSDTPESVTVDGESRKLNAFQKQFYDSVWKEAVGGVLDEVVDSGAFQEADQQLKTRMLRELYSYAGELAKAEVFDDYPTSTGTEKAKKVLQSGLDMAGYLALKAAGGVDRYLKAVGQGMRAEDAAQAALAVSEIKDAAAEKTPKLDLWRQALRSTRDQDEQLAALSMLMSDGEYARLEVGIFYGITPEEYVTARESIARIDTNQSVSQDEATRAIGTMLGLTDEERAVLWQIQNKGWKPEKNPFSKKVGEKIYKDLQNGGGKLEKPRQKSSGELKGLSLPSLN